MDRQPLEETFGAKNEVNKGVKSSSSESMLVEDRQTQLLKGTERLYGVIEHLGNFLKSQEAHNA